MVCPRRSQHVPVAPYFTKFVEEGRRGDIMDAALAVFGEKGYEAGTMREIATRVGVSEPAIYRHYESKEALLTDIVATAGDHIVGQLRTALSTVNGDNLVASLQALVEFRREVAARKKAAKEAAAKNQETPLAEPYPGEVMHALFHAAPHNETFISSLRQHLTDPMMAALRELVPRIDADLGINRSAETIDDLVRVFVSLLIGYTTTSAIFGQPARDDALVHAVLAIMGWEPTRKNA
jgi:AcrR family transcriptional regulator